METEEYYGETYPEPPEVEQRTLKVDCYFTTYVTVFGDNEENWETQLDEMDKYDFLEEADKIYIDNWKEI